MTPGIAILSLVQVACVLIGFLALGLVLKIWGYPAEPSGSPTVVCMPLAIFLRTYGLLLLGLPIFWTFGAVVAVQGSGGWWLEGTAILAGVLVCVAVALSFLYAAVFPIGRLQIVGLPG